MEYPWGIGCNVLRRVGKYICVCVYIEDLTRSILKIEMNTKFSVCLFCLQAGLKFVDKATGIEIQF